MVVQRPKADDKRRQGCARQSLAVRAGAVKPNATTTAFVEVTANLRRASRANRVRRDASIRRRRQQPVNLKDVKAQLRQLAKRYLRRNVSDLLCLQEDLSSAAKAAWEPREMLSNPIY